MQVGPVAMLVPARIAQEAELAMDRTEGKASFMLPEEVSGPEVVTENEVSAPIVPGQTSVFSGTIGADTSYSATAGASNTVIITPALSICSFTFNPNLVYTSPTDLIMTLTTVNEFPSTGTIGLQFPSNRKWSQDLDTARTMPISTGAMVCNSQSAVQIK